MHQCRYPAAHQKPPLRDTENADIPIMAPGFGSDFVELIEQNRRRSIATSRILRLRHGEIWPEDGMLKRDIGVFRVPKDRKGRNEKKPGSHPAHNHHRHRRIQHLAALSGQLRAGVRQFTLPDSLLCIHHRQQAPTVKSNQP